MKIIYQLTIKSPSKESSGLLFFESKEAANAYWMYIEHNKTPLGNKNLKITGEEVELLNLQDVENILTEDDEPISK